VASTPREAVSPRYRSYVLGVLFVVYVFNFIDRQVLGILIGPIKEDLGVSDTVMGLLAGPAFALFYTLAGIPIARIADTRSRRTVIAASLTLWSAMTAATGLARSVWHLGIARVLVGVGEAGGSPPSHSLLSDYFPPERRASALALYANGIYVGSGLAYLFGAWVYTHFDWRVTYYALGLVGLPLAALVMTTVRELPRGLWETATPPQPAPLREVTRFLRSRRTFVWLVVAACFQSMAGYGILLWGAEFLVRVHEMSRLDVGVRMGLTLMIGGCVGVTLGGWLADRLGARDPRWYLWLPAAVALLSLPLGIGFVLAGSATGALLCFAPYYTIANMYVGPLWSVPQNLVPAEMRATTSAILLFILNLAGLGLGSFAVGALNDALAGRYGELAIRWSLLMVVAAGGIAAIFYGLASRHAARELA
jgi:predicted MFS family arabinose efflux permease